ncbi:hypothetical protein BJF96_g10011 [Verticillium dahliae]|uniref:Uncharacterized protein n=1 Tax=Verticillium dahliae TaxID=27337 RepID=A0AA44WCS7_VERDA|nr:hypothetical protein BJF96_g10011 [Verticillium dahliae]PNH44453.1 hypothetical protein VD0003_g9421 [Verticillium dahliae]
MVAAESYTCELSADIVRIYSSDFCMVGVCLVFYYAADATQVARTEICLGVHARSFGFADLASGIGLHCGAVKSRWD